MHIHTCAYFYFLFFFYIYTNAHPQHKQMSPKELRSIMDERALKRQNTLNSLQ